MQSLEIREKFLKFFEGYHHQRVKSSSLIPAADPTLLFTNAGMVQFKDNFLGLTDAGYKRATTCQKCVRAGGKHNDLENVGFTPRHHTFFEMLGNFSFGDYFKKDAIAYAWELVTKVYGIPKDKLQVTVFRDDDEAFDLWKAQGIKPEWITRLGEKDNFWAMGDTGPCGPCSEIYFDLGEKAGCGKPTCTNPGCECGKRFLEIWNLVFMQFNRDTTGKMNPLPKPSVDTGAGLERVAAVLQNKASNYETDIFSPIFDSLRAKMKREFKNDEIPSTRVIADHLRSGTFLLSDGVIPSNEGRGYVLRRILRRAIRHGKKLGFNDPFMFDLVSSVTSSMGSVYPDIVKNKSLIETMMKEEETRFHETLHRGMGLLEESIADSKKKKQSTISGDIAFKLYDTFGFPFDLIEVIGRENDMTVDDKQFNVLMEKQRSLSVWSKGGTTAWIETVSKVLEAKKHTTTFHGYETLKLPAKLESLFDKDGKELTTLEAGKEGFAVFDKTPFYAESGGQVGDKGEITAPGTVAKVTSTSKLLKSVMHWVTVESGKLSVGGSYQLGVDSKARKLTAINHTATHMLHAALRNVLGDRVKQAGSLVDPGRLRFDFTFPRPLTEEEVQNVESIINREVQLNHPVSVKEMGYDDAIKSGALAFFDEKYGDKVRVVRVGVENSFSVELCGGTHLENISDIGFFKILSESSVASGVRRIEAITGETALEFLLERSKTLESLEKRLGVKSDLVTKKIDQLLSDVKALQRENEKLQVKAAQAGGGGKSDGGGGGALWEKKIQIKDYQVVREQLPAVNPKVLRSLVDQIRDKLKDKVLVMLASESEGKAFLCVGLSKDLVGKLDAAVIIKPLAEEVGGTGGGRGDFAQAGGSNPAGLSKALEKFETWVRENA